MDVFRDTETSTDMGDSKLKGRPTLNVGSTIQQAVDPDGTQIESGCPLAQTLYFQAT